MSYKPFLLPARYYCDYYDELFGRKESRVKAYPRSLINLSIS